MPILQIFQLNWKPKIKMNFNLVLPIILLYLYQQIKTIMKTLVIIFGTLTAIIWTIVFVSIFDNDMKTVTEAILPAVGISISYIVFYVKWDIQKTQDKILSEIKLGYIK